MVEVKVKIRRAKKERKEKRRRRSKTLHCDERFNKSKCDKNIPSYCSL
jgi:hypothetical protein